VSGFPARLVAIQWLIIITYHGWHRCGYTIWSEVAQYRRLRPKSAILWVFVPSNSFNNAENK